MNPNKKILNPKNNSPWLLCPSKSFPGKFYYFNGSTGETAWCLSETDKYPLCPASDTSSIPLYVQVHEAHEDGRVYPVSDHLQDPVTAYFVVKNLKKGTIHRVTDKTHTYPEPFEPPIDDSTNTTNSFTSLKNAGNTEIHKEIRPPAFGQAIFPKYVPTEMLTPKFVWALTPMYMPSQVPHSQMLDQVTQTYHQPMFMQNQFEPLKRTEFVTPIQFQNPPFQQYKEKPMFEPNFKTINSQTQTFAKPAMKDEACQTFVPRTKRQRTLSESDSAPKSIQKRSISIENLSTCTKDVETSTLDPSHKDEDNGNLSELDKNDLRFKLVAKKRRVESTGTALKPPDQSKSKTLGVELKKRVTFDLHHSDTSHTSSEGNQETNQSPDSSNKPFPDESPWYVVADAAALLADLQCIEEFVKSDTRCRLLVLHTVYAELEVRSRDPGAVGARQLLRKLAGHDNNIVVQSKPDYELASDDSILRCCWDLLQEGCHVVLVTNNTSMLTNAKTIDLECYTLDEIKLDNQTSIEPQNDHQRDHQTVENNKKKSENLFLQDLNEINGFCLTKPNGLIRDSRMNVFNADTDNAFSKRDANSDKLINITRPKNNASVVNNSEITHVKDQITNLCISEPRVQNTTKQIMKNMFWSNNNIDQNTIMVDLQNDNYKSNSNNRLDNDQNAGNVLQSPEIIDEIDRDIRRLNVTEINLEKPRDAIRVSGITKLNNQFNLDEDLKRFYVKNPVMENRVKSRLDEWVCRLNQTMEEVLTEILLIEKTKVKHMMPPWNLYEAIQVTGEAFKKQSNIKTIIDKFSMNLLKCSSNNGRLNKDLKPNDLMTLVGLSLILIEHLKEIANYKQLYEAHDTLVDLFKNIEDPKTDIDLSLEKVNTPIISRSEISDVKAPVGFRKSQTEIVDYLRKHFPAWKNEIVNPTDKDKVNKEPNVLRTSGKNLNTLKINNTRTITVDNKDVDKTTVSNQPTVIRNVKIIAAFEERLKKKAELDLDQLDYEESQTVYTLSDDNDDVRSNYDRSQPDNDLLFDDLSVSSSANTECVRAYPLVRIFLVKLKVTLTKIFNFVNTTIEEFKEGMCMERKADALLKTELARQYLMKIAERLENIIARESGAGAALKDLLIKAGDYVEDDTMMNNYKQTVTKFLEQTRVLEKVLEHTLSLLKVFNKKEKEDCSNSYNVSPVLPTRRLRSFILSNEDEK